MLIDAGHHDGGVEEISGVPPQITATLGVPEHKAVAPRQARVREILHILPKDAQAAILNSMQDAYEYPADELAANGPGSQPDCHPDRAHPRIAAALTPALAAGLARCGPTSP